LTPLVRRPGEASTGGASALEINGVSKRFGDFLALDQCSLSVKPAEVLALLGPSGCGKTSLLNVVAGFERPDQGSVAFDGVPIDQLAPNRRGVGMVFQNYALFPHLTVAGNIGYGLRILKLPSGEMDARVAEVLRLMKLDRLAERYPYEISGGQRQRVAVARAMVTHPRILLMDEAFSALDRNLREAMQLELSLLLRGQGITTILVTHDQKEAFTLADRIAVMDHGRILQVGGAEELYRRPGSRFVLDFLGASNRFKIARLSAEGDSLHLEAEPGIACCMPKPPSGGYGDLLWLHVRPEDLRLSACATAVHRDAPATVDFVTFQGSVRRTVLRQGERQIIADLPDDAPVPTIGAAVFLDFDPQRAFLLEE